MQELAGRLTALDPEASESLKAISFFDTLISSGAGAESIVRGTVMISGTAAGAVIGERTLRIAADGSRATGGGDEHWPFATSGADVRVWIERSGPPHANDEMILERAALALAILEARRRPETTAIEALLDPDSSVDARATAARRLRLTEGPLRVVAAPPDHTLDGALSTVLATPEGLVRIGLSTGIPEHGPAGTAIAHDLDAVAQTCVDARIALRLVDERHPIVDAADLGVFIAVARTLDPAAAPLPDVAALLQFDDRSLTMLDILVESESVRAAASALSMHHSSLQSRHTRWTQQLGYDPLSARGRMRYSAARMLARLSYMRG